MFALQTRNGIVTFNTEEEYNVWMKTGMNRFSVLSELEEIDIIEPAPYAFEVWACQNDTRIVFFDTLEEAEEYAGDDLRIEYYKREV